MPVIHRRRVVIEKVQGVPVIRVLPRPTTSQWNYAHVSLGRAWRYVTKTWPTRSAPFVY